MRLQPAEENLFATPTDSPSMDFVRAIAYPEIGLLFNPPSHTGQFQFAQEAFSVAFLYGGGLRATLKP